MLTEQNKKFLTTTSIALDQLVKNRNDLIEAHKKNNFTDGIHALLTDLYPDTAHFIYELLQNAEDMNATVVRFILDKDGIDFEHNGTKRSFNISDIDAITNIGNNGQKKDDPTSIGKFGVGFKAVFAYTKTPIIHSGNYHFKIRDYFVPEFQNVTKINTVDNAGVSWTKFSFPFNNPKKPANIAYEECLEGLKGLDDTAILFLQNISKIEYMFPTGDYGYVERDDEKSNHISIVYQKPFDQKKSISKWLRFNKIIDFTDDQKNIKKLSIAVAFAIDYDNKSNTEKIVPVKGGGKTFIYFPAEKEHSGLRFHINAPFASTVARDSVRNCSDNINLIKNLSLLIVESLPKIKKFGMMNHSFFDVLPNQKDNLSPFYSYIFDYIYSAFQNNEYLPTKDGNYVSADSALIGPAAISNLFKNNDFQFLTGTKKKWILNAPQKNSFADSFIHSLDIETYSYDSFVNLFDFESRGRLEELIPKKNLDYLKRFYVLCADAYEYLYYYSQKSENFIKNMKDTIIIKSREGELYKATDIFILPKNVQLITKTTPIVDQQIIFTVNCNSKLQ